VRLTLVVGRWVLVDLELFQRVEDADDFEALGDNESVIEEVPPRFGFDYDPEDD
jgi:hypothetical protein